MEFFQAQRLHHFSEKDGFDGSAHQVLEEVLASTQAYFEPWTRKTI